MLNKRGNGRGGSEIFFKFNKWEVGDGVGGVGISKYPLISVTNEKRHNLILMLNLEVSKQTSSEVSNIKVMIKRASNISIN